VRRIALLFALLLVLSAIGAVTLVVTMFGGGPGSAHLPAGFLALVTAVLLFALLSTALRRVGGPLADIVEAANRVADGDYSTRITPHGPRSLRTVGSAFNTMTARLQAQDRQRRDLMADIAHELRTPLTVIQGRLEGILDGLYARDDARLGEVLEEIGMMSRLVEDLRTLANAESGALSLQKEPTVVSELIGDAVASLAAEAASHAVTVRVDLSADLPLVTVDALRIREVLLNLLSNAFHHTPAGGRVTITARAIGRAVVVTIADTGPGIAGDDLSRIFDRFYKGAASRGSGLGLTIARNLVTAHGGEIRAESRPGEGATITFTLPA
jgi:two-component system OmpR family sensor kinase/two-component system sensor histidine kinase BaeS